ncbi:MAG: phosphocholine cytidylyltransferase family protein [Lachnospiraceae bacterium]|nr:phosphocholine cytidylyltransferase family protein [Lachnospiraceae bacterium]
MKAIILAAGQGTRLKKYTENLPKGMLEFNGKTLIERQIELFRKCNIDNIIIVRGYAADKINYKDVTYYTNEDYTNTNMVESLLKAKDEFDDDVIVSYSDVLFEKEMLQNMIESQYDYAVAVDDNWEKYWKKRYGRIDFDTESLSIDDCGNITEIGLEDPPLEKIDARYIGLLKFSKSGCDKIISMMEKAYVEYENKESWQQSGKPVRKAYMTDLLNALIESGESVKAIHFNNGWIEFDTNDDYENAVRWVRDSSIRDLLKLN